MPNLSGLKTLGNAEKARKLKPYEKEVKSNTTSPERAFINRILGLAGAAAGLHGAAVSSEEIIYSDAERENELRKGKLTKENAEEINSRLTLSPMRNNLETKEAELMEGIIDGKKIIIKHGLKGVNFDCVGTIDGHEILAEDAKAIFEKYKQIALDRTARIASIGLEKENQKENISRKKEGEVNDGWEINENG